MNSKGSGEPAHARSPEPILLADVSGTSRENLNLKSRYVTLLRSCACALKDLFGGHICHSYNVNGESL